MGSVVFEGRHAGLLYGPDRYEDDRGHYLVSCAALSGVGLVGSSSPRLVDGSCDADTTCDSMMNNGRRSRRRCGYATGDRASLATYDPYRPYVQLW